VIKSNLDDPTLESRLDTTHGAGNTVLTRAGTGAAACSVWPVPCQ
jgi:hypothetical protein